MNLLRNAPNILSYPHQSSGNGSSSDTLSGLDDSQLGSFDSTAESIPDSMEQNDHGITYVSPGEFECQQSDIQQLEPQICQHGQQQDRPDYVKGACAFQLTQYLYQQRHRPTDNNIEFWHKFVSDFFTNDAKKRLCVSAYLNRSLSSDSTGSSQGWHCEFCNQKAFHGYEAIAEALPRLFQIKYERPTLEELLYVDMPREFQNSSGQIVLHYEQARQEGVYENLRIIRDGQLRVVFSPELKIGSWEFCAQRHEELIPRNLIKTKARQLADAAQKCRFSAKNALWLFEPGLENSFTRVNESASHLTEALETSLFTGYGYSLRYIRYLQVLMIDNSLKEAMDFSRVSGKRPMDRLVPSLVSFPLIETRADLFGSEIHFLKLVEDLKIGSINIQRQAIVLLRLLAKYNTNNWFGIFLANCGVISILVDLLRSTDIMIQENAVAALRYLSINDINKATIVNADAIEPLIHVLETGSPEARENSVATLFCLSVIEDNKVMIGRSGAVGALVDLMGNGTPKGKKNAASALFNLSILDENKARIVQAGAVKHIVELMDPAGGMVEKAVAILGNLVTISEGRTAIGEEGGIPALVEVVKSGSTRGKQNAAAALLQLCTNSSGLCNTVFQEQNAADALLQLCTNGSGFCNTVFQEGGVAPLVELSLSANPGAKEMAQELLSYLQNQGHGNASG